MILPDYNSANDLKRILDEQGFSMQKKFGQNFLINPEARKKLIDYLEIDENSFVWEVGPGLGAMTKEILNRNSTLKVFEIDKGFIQLLSTYFDDYTKQNKFSIISGDVLKNWKTEIKKQVPNRFFGNLPYNISATLIANTIEENYRFEKCVFTIQKEVAQRMCAKVNTSDYSSFSLLCQWAYDIKPIMDLSGANFWPRPNVDSRAVLMTPKKDFPQTIDSKLFVKVQRALFSSRRKTVKNNLSIFLQNKELTQECLEQSKIDPIKRAETLTLEQMLLLTDTIHNLKK